jgi:hypothetical protein
MFTNARGTGRISVTAAARGRIGNLVMLSQAATDTSRDVVAARVLVAPMTLHTVAERRIIEPPTTMTGRTVIVRQSGMCPVVGAVVRDICVACRARAEI